MALSFVLSWYDKVRLDQLATRRAGAAAMSDADVAELHSRACAIASYVNTEEYVPDPDADAEAGAGGDGDDGDDDDDDGDDGDDDNGDDGDDVEGSSSEELQF
jgi:hypothetical protein